MTQAPKAFAVLLAVLSVFLLRDLFFVRVPAFPAADAAANKISSARIATAPDAVSPENVGLPVRLKIYRIGVNAVIEKVGLKKDGSMDVPAHPMDVAWYGFGPRPGETGSAVMAGHVDWWYGAKAAFANLRKLKPGDKISVQDDRGAIIFFTVRGSRAYDAAADVADVFTSADGKAHLNLVTCFGKWDKLAKQYSKRLVVFADRETE